MATPNDRRVSRGNDEPVRLAVLGSTGSIGTQTLDIARLFPERLQVDVLSAHRNVELLIEQAREFNPSCVVIGDETRYDEVKSKLPRPDIDVFVGPSGLEEAVSREAVDTVVAAVMGFAGLTSVLAAIRARKVVALANKETLVAAGALVNETLKEHEGVLLPIDSEHSAIFQCLVGEPLDTIEELILTASGGPFRKRAKETFGQITRQEALNHPNWTMGSKITIDSATMMNKGLEVIEARWMFDIPVHKIDVLVHPQSIIHSMVLFTDGSTKAQLGVPDMRVPIQYALTYPDRWEAPHPRISWKDIARLDFEVPDVDKFPCVRLAYQALEQGGLAPAVLNAANEAAVRLFLQDVIRFVDIPDIIASALDRFGVADQPSLENLIETHCLVENHIQELYGARAN